MFKLKIDFHTHAFNEKIAAKAIGRLAEVSGMTPLTDGSLGGLVKRLDEYGIDRALVLSIATKPSQEDAINSWVIEKSAEYADRLSFVGSVHPDSENPEKQLVALKNAGIRGIKLHPDYQGFMIDDKKMFRIYELCQKLELFIVFHAGFDPLSPDKFHCVPRASARVAEYFPYLTMVLAHLGGMRCWDDVERYITGKYPRVYLDTAIISTEIDPMQYYRIIRKHGADKILLGSDMPWEAPTAEIDAINSLELTENEREMIFYKNAGKLLGLPLR